MNWNSPLVRAAAAVASVAIACGASAQSGLNPENLEGDTSPPLTLLADAPENASPEQGLGIERARVASLDLAALEQAAPGSERTLQLDLFDDVSVIAEPISVTPNGQNAYIWRGRLQNVPGSSVLIAVRDGDAFGEIRNLQEGRVYEIRHNHPGHYSIVELNEFALPSCGVLPEHAISHEAADPENLEGQLRGDITTVDVMVAYTPQAAALGNILPLIDSAVAVTNDSYEDSLMSIRLNLVHTHEVDYVETGFLSADLDRLRGTGDIYMPEIHTLRNDFGADMVALLVASGDNCGVAFLMNTPTVFFDDNAFSVTLRGCAVGNRTFAHELGHNLGCNHDRDNAGGGGSYPYSYGHRTPSNVRTIMAYAPGTRVSFFSNPNIGDPPNQLGVPVGEPGEAYNALGIDNVRDIAAAWRDSTQGTPCPADVSGDGQVSSTDLGVLLGSWGTSGSSDIDGDGSVGSSDLGLLLGSWGPCPE